MLFMWSFCYRFGIQLEVILVVTLESRLRYVWTFFGRSQPDTLQWSHVAAAAGCCAPKIVAPAGKPKVTPKWPQNPKWYENNIKNNMKMTPKRRQKQVLWNYFDVIFVSDRCHVGVILKSYLQSLWSYFCVHFGIVVVHLWAHFAVT